MKSKILWKNSLIFMKNVIVSSGATSSISVPLYIVTKLIVN